MTDVLELLCGDNSQPVYALALPFNSSAVTTAEYQTEYLQNQLQSLVNQVQCEDISNIEDSSDCIDTINKIIPEEQISWSLPIYPAGENALNIQTLDIIHSQSILNGISNEMQDVEYLIEEDDNYESHTKDYDTRYMISLNGMQYGVKLVPSLDHNGSHCSQFKILLNAENVPDASNGESDSIEDDRNGYEYPQIYDGEINDMADLVQAYKCRKCFFTVEDKQLLIDHYKTEHTNTVGTKIKKEGCTDIDSNTYDFNEIEIKSEQLMYMCGQCTQGFASIDDCKAHMIKDHKLTRKNSETDISSNAVNKRLSEEICLMPKFDDDRKESHWMLINNHKELKAALMLNWQNKCLVNNCPYRFKDCDSLEKHAKCHKISSKLFSCFKCNEEFLNWRTCSVHLWRAHAFDIDMLTCPICNDYKTPTTVKLSLHMKIHSLSKSFICGECGKAFKQSTQLHNHKVIHIARKKTQIQRWYTAKKCEICLKSFANTKCLKKHIQAIHSKIRPFICNVCGHSCTRKAMLQMHLRQHTGEKPYACTECDYRTSDHNTLRRHLMRHTGVRPYRCSYCPYAAIQSCAFKMHMKTKHNDKPGVYCCNLCSFRTVNKNIYEFHVSDHERGLINMGKIERTDWKLHIDREKNMLQSIYRHRDKNELESSAIKVSNRDSEDDDTQHCFLMRHQNNDNSEDAIDTGGVTIPADDEV